MYKHNLQSVLLVCVYLYDCPLEMDNQLGYASVGKIGSPSFSNLMSSVVSCLEPGLMGFQLSMLVYLLALFRSCLGSHLLSFDEYVASLLFLGDTISLQISWSSDSCNLSSAIL